MNRYQKRIVCLGMDGREISPHDIYQAIGSKDRDIYDRELKELRESGILISTRTNMQAKQVARRQRNLVPQRVGRFKVVAPDPSASFKQFEADWRQRNPRHCAYVGFIPLDASPDDIKMLFSRCGDVLEVVLPGHPASDGHRGFGYVWFGDERHASRAIAELHRYEWRGRWLRVQRFDPHPVRRDGF